LPCTILGYSRRTSFKSLILVSVTPSAWSPPKHVLGLMQVWAPLTAIPLTCTVVERDLSFPQLFCWRIWLSEIWRCVARLMIPDVSTEWRYSWNPRPVKKALLCLETFHDTGLHVWC
jgi:hypothetical protein